MINRFRPGGRGLALALSTALLALGATAASASATTTTFTNGDTVKIPDSGTATPYPSTINVTGMAANITKATVTLNTFIHTYPDDLDVLLVGPTGANTVLMGQVGGTDDPGPIDVTFDQDATATLNSSDTMTAGTYQPSESGATASLDAPAPPAPYPVDLGVFNNTPGNGAWQLYILDTDSGDSGALANGWSVNLTGPYNGVTVKKPKQNWKKGTATLPVTVGDAGQLTLSGKGVKTASASKAVAVGGAGSTTLTVRAKGKTKRKLDSVGRATVRVKIAFTPNGGSTSVQTKKVKLKKTFR